MNFLNLGFFPLLAVLAFIAVVLLVEGLYMIWNSYRGPEAMRIEQRLRNLSSGPGTSGPAAVLRNRTLSNVPSLEKLLQFVPGITKLDRLLFRSGLEWSVARFVLLSVFSGVLAFAVLSKMNLMPIVQVGLALAAVLLPLAYVKRKSTKRMRKLEEQLPETLDLICRALRAGQALPAGLQLAGQEMSDPIAKEFRVTNDEINFGTSLQGALTNLSERVPTTDMRYFVVAVLVQREAGGNLTEVLDSLSKLIRNRLKFQGRVKVLTTEGRMSAWVLGMLPFFIAGVLYFVNYNFISILWKDPAGIMITNGVLAMMAVGGLWLYKLVRIRV